MQGDISLFIYLCIAVREREGLSPQLNKSMLSVCSGPLWVNAATRLETTQMVWPLELNHVYLILQLTGLNEPQHPQHDSWGWMLM